jgi:hypothetical protein
MAGMCWIQTSVFDQDSTKAASDGDGKEVILDQHDQVALEPILVTDRWSPGRIRIPLPAVM